jgi:hypothetical protein
MASLSLLELEHLKGEQNALLQREDENSILRPPSTTEEKTDGVLTMEALQQQTKRLETELTYQRALLSKLQQSPAESSPTSPPSATILQPFSSSIRVGDAYGGLLNELQDVREQITQYVDPGEQPDSQILVDTWTNTASASHNVTNAPSSSKVTIVSKRNGANQRPQTPSSRSVAGNIRQIQSVSPKSHLDGGFRQIEIGSGELEALHAGAAETNTTRIKSRRSKKVKEYRERFLEEREVLLADLEQRLSRDAARSARHTLNSSLRPSDVDSMARNAAHARGGRLANLTNSFVVETQDALRAMRERLENEQSRQLASVRAAFEEDKERLLLDLETTGRLEREEAIRMVVEVNRAEKERLVSEEHRRARDQMNREIARMKANLNAQLKRPASELVLEDERFQELADEELRLREKLEAERRSLELQLKDQLDLQVQEQRAKMLDEHRERVEALTLDVLSTHETYLKNERRKALLEQQHEQEVVLKELGEALRYGTSTSLEKFRHELEEENERKASHLRQQMKQSEKIEMEKLRRKMKLDSDTKMRQVREESASSLEVETAKVKAEIKADHAARIHKLQLDLKGQREREISQVRKMMEDEFRSKVDTMKASLEKDIGERSSEMKMARLKDLKLQMEEQIENGKRTERIELAAIRERFDEEANAAFNYVDEYFSISRKNLSAPFVNVDVPDSADEMRSRLNSLRRQFDTFMRRYELASEKLGELQNDMISARMNSARQERLIEELRGHATGRDTLEVNARKLYMANEHLIDQVNVSRRARGLGGDRR